MALANAAMALFAAANALAVAAKALFDAAKALFVTAKALFDAAMALFASAHTLGGPTDGFARSLSGGELEGSGRAPLERERLFSRSRPPC